jgi:phosphoribosyl 1,2-cyclic phosphate phosphodiesterase
MRVCFLGTAAAEGVPSPFCRCAGCEEARATRGRQIRRRSAVLVNDDLLIDPGPDLGAACADHGVALDGLRYVLVTHSHFDHFYPCNLEIRSARYMDRAEPRSLDLVAGGSSLALLSQLGYDDAQLRVQRRPIRAADVLALPPYQVRAVAATHAPEVGDAMNFLIGDGETSLLYAVDTGLYAAPALQALAGAEVDLLIMDATNGFGETSENHLNHQSFAEQLRRLREHRVLRPEAVLIASHFSHLRNPSHDELTRRYGALGVGCAYDGLVIRTAER